MSRRHIISPSPALPPLHLPYTDMYYLAFPSDGYLRKLVVCLAFSIECAQTVLATWDAFRQFSSGWGNLLQLDDIGLYWLSILVLTMLSAMLSQYFYAWRILMLSHQRWMAAIVVVVCCSATFGLFYSVVYSIRVCSCRRLGVGLAWLLECWPSE